MLIDTNRNVTAALPRLKAASVTSICRYLSVNDSEKVIKRPEAQAIAAAGLRLWLVYEVAGRPNGAAIGHRDGRCARDLAPKVGAPPGAAIYYTVDFDAGPSDLPGIVEAFRAFRAEVSPTYRVGCYASGYVCGEIKKLGLCEFRWLTDSTGFRGTREAIAAGDYDIRQALPHEVGGLDTDPDTVRVANGDIGDFVPTFPDVTAAPVQAPVVAQPATAATETPAAPPAQSSASPAKIAGLLPQTVAAIVTLAADSDLIRHNWGGRGLAPRGYIKGMAVAFGAIYGGLSRRERAAVAAAMAVGSPATDALAWYAGKFAAAGMDNSVPGGATLRHLFVLMTGLGMRESSGRYCEGRDRSAHNVTADTAEAGLFQMSWNAHVASTELPILLQSAIATPISEEDGLLPIFREGVTPHDGDLSNYGSGDGETFQNLCKSRPLFAVRCAAVGLRTIGGNQTGRGHWGPVNRREAELYSGADALFQQVQNLVDAEGAVA